MARLYADENFDYPVVVILRQFGHDVVRAQEVGQAGQRIPDPAVLAYATADGRAVLTLNRWHFKRLHRQGVPHAGIITCTRDDDSAALATRIHTAIAGLPDLTNQLVEIIRPATP
jgi:hypothetical protein